MTTFPLSGPLAKWLSSSFHWRNGMAFGLTVWLPLADRMKQKWWCQLDTRPQRSCLCPPTFNTSAFTVSSQVPREERETWAQIQINRTAPNPELSQPLRPADPLINVGMCQQAQLGSCDQHTPELHRCSRLISYRVRADYCKFISPCCRRRNWGSARLSDLQN